MIIIPNTMKLVQIVYLTILTAASGATEVLTADCPEGTVACSPPCTAQQPSSCPAGTSPYKRPHDTCWACCYPNWTWGRSGYIFPQYKSNVCPVPFYAKIEYLARITSLGEAQTEPNWLSSNQSCLATALRSEMADDRALIRSHGPHSEAQLA